MANKSKNKNKATPAPRAKQGFWDAVIRAMELGQLPLFFLFGVITVILIRLPQDEMTEFLAGIFIAPQSMVTALLVGTGWFVHVRWQHRFLKGEIDRLAGQRNRWQGMALGDNLGSSEDV
jgi:phosphatidylglycerophosphate synthase